MLTEAEKDYLVRMQRFLRERWEAADQGSAVVRRHELAPLSEEAGLEEPVGWNLFALSESYVWRGSYVPESRSEVHGFTAAKLEWVVAG
jgi:hypothetical protein